jgi:holliday junction DNA helicase RuvA
MWQSYRREQWPDESESSPFRPRTFGRRPQHPRDSGLLCTMISRLEGTLEAVDGMEATVRPAGLGVWYQVLIPAFEIERLGRRVGQTVTLHTIEYLEGQGVGSSFIPRLIGFTSEQDRRFFDLLTSVDGFGNKKALRAMAEQPAAISRAILEADAVWLTKLPEVGKKSAEKVILELKGKVGSFLSADEVKGLDIAAGSMPASGPVDEAIAAIVQLGEGRADAERMVRKALTRNKGLKTADQIVAAAYGG